MKVTWLNPDGSVIKMEETGAIIRVDTKNSSGETQTVILQDEDSNGGQESFEWTMNRFQNVV